MSELADLIKRLEAATEGSLDLDCEIHKALNPLYVQNSQWPALFLHAGHSRSMAPGESRSHQVPHYTRSLDAALTLVPEGWGSKIIVRKDGTACASVFNPTTGEEFDQNGRQQDAKGNRPSVMEFAGSFKPSPSPALALCIAALKARNATEEALK